MIATRRIQVDRYSRVGVNEDLLMEMRCSNTEIKVPFNPNKIIYHQLPRQGRFSTDIALQLWYFTLFYDLTKVCNSICVIALANSHCLSNSGRGSKQVAENLISLKVQNQLQQL
jgi:hypothetical protein